MNRRSFLAMFSAVPFVGRLVPSANARRLTMLREGPAMSVPFPKAEKVSAGEIFVYLKERRGELQQALFNFEEKAFGYWAAPPHKEGDPFYIYNLPIKFADPKDAMYFETQVRN